jgi:Xaa-Pro aminopeptidase
VISLRKAHVLFAYVIALLAVAGSASAQQAFDAGEFAGRRARLLERVDNGAAVILGAPSNSFPLKFRQAPDFYYLTGIEEPGAVLVLAKKKATVYAPRRPAWKIPVEGPGILERGDAERTYGVEVRPLEDLMAGLRSAVSAADTLFLPLTPPDELELARVEAAMMQDEAREHPLYGRESLAEAVVARIRALEPKKPAADVNPILDRMRWVKSPYEIALMRETGRIGAEGVKEAMRATKPGMYEYEIEAAARYVYVKSGARGDAFTPIVASGPNTPILHYVANNRKMEAGDVVYMDYGTDYRYYTSDITRTWPVSGTFTPAQEKMYRTILDARDAVLAAMKPGVTIGELQRVAARAYARNGFAREFEASGNYIGHPVGLSVHDPWPAGPMEALRLEPGVLWNLEPLIEVNGVHMRLEDTVLITATGAENLTAGVPAALEEVYALVKEERKVAR